jgi:hypothetical protein
VNGLARVFPGLTVARMMQAIGYNIEADAERLRQVQRDERDVLQGIRDLLSRHDRPGNGQQHTSGA